MCVNPYIAKRKDGTPVPVPCGRCLDCRRQFQTEWIFRLSQEAKRSICPCFITLTYNDEHLPLMADPETGELKSVVSKRDFQLFMKRLRKIGGEQLDGCRYFAVGEYGSRFNRAHMHAVIIAPGITLASELGALVKKAWTLGFSKTQFATERQFHYICKYMNKIDEREHIVPPFRLYSRSIGLNYLTQKIVDYYLTTFSRTCKSGNATIGLPRYYKRKLDEISVGVVPGFKEANLCYSDMLEDIKPVPGTKYYYLKYFTEHFDEIYQEACVHICTEQIAFDDKDKDSPLVFMVVRPTRQQVWRHYVNTTKAVRDMIFEDSRLLSECKIRNKIVGAQPVNYNLAASVILSEAI